MRRGMTILVLMLAISMIFIFLSDDLGNKITGKQVLECIEQDLDNDGFIGTTTNCVVIDCDDTSLVIYPFAQEICDGADNQCPGNPGSGLVDEGCSSCTDNDLGVNYTWRGSAFGLSDKSTPSSWYNHTDSCFAGLSKLSEYSCKPGTQTNSFIFSNSTFNCPKDCVNGACVCIPNWVNVSTCLGDINDTHQIDLNACGQTPPKTNITQYLDCNNNKVIGDFCQLNIDKAFIGNYLVNESLFSGNKSVKFVEEKVNVTFNWDFANTLNICQVEIETSEENDNRGYSIVKNLESMGKTILFDKLNSRSNSTCIIDSGEVEFDDFTANCNSDEEILVECPGSSSGYNCAIVGKQFKVWPLNHSAVREVVVALQGCIPSWDCLDWSECIDEEQTRTCTDINSCNTLFGKPVEIQDCTVDIAECVPNWYCSWKACQEDGFKYYACQDSNNCGTLEGKPSKDGDVYECKKHAGNLLFVLIAIIGIILLLLVLIFILKKRKSQENYRGSAGLTPVHKPAPPTPPEAPQTPVLTTIPPTMNFYTPRPAPRRAPIHYGR